MAREADDGFAYDLANPIPVCFARGVLHSVPRFIEGAVKLLQGWRVKRGVYVVAHVVFLTERLAHSIADYATRC